MAIERRIPATHVQSLVWDGDELVDWAGGGRRFALDGTVTERAVLFSEIFNAAVRSPSGSYAAIIARIGTKAIILRDGAIVRQVNRDFYHADAYGYPLAFAQLTDGREVLIHCPENYSRLEIEDIVTGERVPSKGARNPEDFFQSGLAVSPKGRWLLSAGWVWHPVHVVNFYDLAAAMRDEAQLDRPAASPPGRWEVGSAAFVDDETVMVGTMDEFFGDEGNPVDDRPGKHAVALWPVGSEDYTKAIRLAHPPGTLMPVGADFVVTFYERPRLYDLRSGALVAEWRIDSGRQTGAITWSHLPPPIALQPERARFAIASATEVHVVEIDRAVLGSRVEP